MDEPWNIMLSDKQASLYVLYDSIHEMSTTEESIDISSLVVARGWRQL